MTSSYCWRSRGVYFSAIDHFSGIPGEPHLLAVLQNLVADLGRLAVLGIAQRDIRNMNRHLLGDDSAFLARRLLLMLADDIHALDQGAVVFRIDTQHFADLALVAAGADDDLVALTDFKLQRHQSTSGASEMIFIWFLARNSRGTGPKIRVPTGSPWALISTAALRSKRMTDPSARRISFAVLTTMAFITLPFLTRPRGMASLTETTMTSPT